MTDAKTAAEAATTPTTFNFAEAVLDRSYPEFEVPVYLNEAAVQQLIESERAIAELELRIANAKNPTLEMAEALEALQTKYDEAKDTLRADEYTVIVRGIAPEEQLALEESTYESFPKEFEETASPITGAKVRTELPNDSRDELFVSLLRRAHLVRVISPTGAIDEDWAELEKVKAMFARLPMVARAKIDEAINKCTIAVDFYRSIVDEVF